jgi:hypothetical protein
MHDRRRHLLQDGRIVGQRVEVHLHDVIMNDAPASMPVFLRRSTTLSRSRQLRFASRHRSAPLTPVEQSRQLDDGQSNPAGRRSRVPNKLPLLQSLRQQAHANPIVPEQIARLAMPLRMSVVRTPDKSARQAEARSPDGQCSKNAPQHPAIYLRADNGNLNYPRSWARCLIPGFDGAVFSLAGRDTLWAKFFTAAPQRLRQSVERYSIVKRA